MEVPITRNEVMSVLELARANAKSERMRILAEMVIEFQEQQWMMMDKLQAAYEKQQQEAAKNSEDEKAKSAAEEYGINSKQAEAKRESRRTKRLANEENKKKALPSPDLVKKIDAELVTT